MRQLLSGFAAIGWAITAFKLVMAWHTATPLDGGTAFVAIAGCAAAACASAVRFIDAEAAR